LFTHATPTYWLAARVDRLRARENAPGSSLTEQKRELLAEVVCNPRLDLARFRLVA